MFGGMFSKLTESVSKLVAKPDTQLADAEEFVYNDKYKAWMPKSADPEQWAKDNLAAPPPPPGGGGGGGGAGAGACFAPQTPGGPGAEGGPARFRAVDSSGGGGRARATPRSRYVDTFNTGGDAGAQGDADKMPPPAARPKPAAPAYKVFTPQKAAGDDGDAGGGGGAMPLFMTPTAQVYADVGADVGAGGGVAE